MMKKKTLIISILLVVLLFVVSGCGKSGQSGNKMLEDLRLQSDVTEWNGLAFELTECEILTQTPQGETQCVYECKILKENEEYEIVANATITYSYGEDIGWRFTDYDENEIDVIPLSGMNDDAVKNRIRIDYTNYDDDNLTISNIKHDFNKEAKTDTIVADYSYSPKWYTKSGTVTMNLEFSNNSWQVVSHSEDNHQMNWNLADLVGTWQITCPGDNYTVEFKVTSVDQSNNTVTMQCRHAPTGFIAGGREGSELIKSEEYTTPKQYTLKFNEDDKDGPYVYVGTYEFYEGLFDHDYSLYVDADAVYVPHGYKDYVTTRID